MTSKVKGTEGIEFPDGSVQGSAAYSKAESNTNLSGKVSKSGDTMSGALTVNSRGSFNIPSPDYALICTLNGVSLSGISFDANGDGGLFLRRQNDGTEAYLQLIPDDGLNGSMIMRSNVYGYFKVSATFANISNGYTIRNQAGTISYALLEGGWAATASKRELKQNIEPVSGALDKINQIQPVTFQYKETPNTDQLGYIAEDVFAVDPFLTYNLDDVPQTVFPDRINILLVQAVKELSTKLDTALARIAELEAK